MTKLKLKSKIKCSFNNTYYQCKEKIDKFVSNKPYCKTHLNYVVSCFCCLTKATSIYKITCSVNCEQHSICIPCMKLYLKNNIFKLRCTFGEFKCLHAEYENCTGILNYKDVMNIISKNKYLNDVYFCKEIQKESIKPFYKDFKTEVQETLTRNRIRYCNECNIKIIRIDACNHIECVCGNVICYNCKQNITNRKCTCPTYTDEDTIEYRSIVNSYNELISKYGIDNEYIIVLNIKEAFPNVKLTFYDYHKKEFFLMILYAIIVTIYLYYYYNYYDTNN